MLFLCRTQKNLFIDFFVKKKNSIQNGTCLMETILERYNYLWIDSSATGFYFDRNFEKVAHR